MINRRTALRLGTAVLLCRGVGVAFAQSRGPRRIGLLSPQSAATATRVRAGLVEGLAALGWQLGKDVHIEERYADGSHERLTAMAAELASLPLDAVVAGSNPGVSAMKRATASTPIVMVTTGDPVADGLVASLARPGANVTGITANSWDNASKWFELMREIAAADRFAVLTNPSSPYFSFYVGRVKLAARGFGVAVSIHEVTSLDDLGSAFADMRARRASALLVMPDIMFITSRDRIVAAASEAKLPAIYSDRSFVDAGGLLSYGASLEEMYREAARILDRILRGASPSDLPVEQATRIEMILNARTAKELGLTIPPAILLRADEIEE